MDSSYYKIEKSVHDKLIQDGATPSGIHWLTRALDPNHDVTIPRVGYPDTVQAQSVVQEFIAQTVIEKPSGVTGNWDCHIASAPIAYSADPTSAQGTTAYFAGNDYGTCISRVTGAGSVLPSGISVVATTSGDPTFTPIAGTATYVTTQIQPDALAVSQAQGITRRARVIAASFEAVDTTASIYQQGSVTVYSIPNDFEQSSWTYATDFPASRGPKDDPKSQPSGYTTPSVKNTLVSTLIAAAPPQTLAQTKQIPNSRTWAAKEGAYVPLRVSGTDIPVRSMAPQVVMQVSYAAGLHYGVDGLGNCITSAAPFVTGGAQPVQLLMDFDISGAYFVGLSENASLTVTTKFIVEQFVSGDQQIAALGQKSPPYDPIVIDYYFKTLGGLPVGVPSPYNASGKWWKTVGSALLKGYDAVKPYAEAVVPMLPPQAQIAFDTADTAVKTGRALHKTVQANRRKKAAAKKQATTKPAS